MPFRFLNVFLLGALFLPLTVSGRREGEQFVPNEVLVKYVAGARPESVGRLNLRLGTTAAEKLGDLGWHRVKLPAGLSVSRAIERFASDESIEAVQPNYYYSVLASTNDPLFITGMYGMTKISAPQAWDLATGSSAVVVADIDTGMRYDHEDLAANAWVNPGETPGNGVDDDGNGYIDDVHGYDFRFNDSDPADENGHGTHTAGTIGAVGNNSLGVVGVNWNVKIMAIKIYSPVGTDTTSAMLLNAYNYVRMMKDRGVNIRVTNNSYGGCNEACGYDQATKDAIDALGDADILNVFAAGNSNTNIDQAPFYPASYTSPSILSVAASDSNDAKAGFSSFGASNVDVAAPGVGIISTWHTDALKYNSISGSSMAAPHASGTAALLASLNPSLSAASLKATLLNTVDPLPQWEPLVRTGGRLNAFKALQNQTECTFTLQTASLLAPTKGGQFIVNVNAPQNCDYSVKSSVNWVVVNAPNVLSGNGQVSFRVRVNRGFRRTGTVKIGGQILSVTQSRDGIN
jgi:subtilisin family serine protease